MPRLTAASRRSRDWISESGKSGHHLAYEKGKTQATLALRAETQTIPILFVNSKLMIPVILILIIVICGAVKSSTDLASAAAAAEPKLPDRATKVKGADEANRRLMAKRTDGVCSLEFWDLQKSTASRSRAPFISSRRSNGTYGVVAASYVIKVEAPNGGN